ncbi:MAG TPA: hypothetical protein VHZ03_12800 [Trebonia sp.]|jgi:hypothetical protein|nr:hypothetical protein [Trebonia sp.]
MGMKSLSGWTGLSRSTLLWLVVLAVVCGIFGVLFITSRASAGPVTPGEYRGTTSDPCPQFAVAEELCNEQERLPITFQASPTEITAIRAVVVERCEDDLPPRITEVDLNRTYTLRREGADRATFNIKLGGRRRPSNEAEGIVRRQVARISVGALNKDPDDPNHEAYCYGGAGGRLTPATTDRGAGAPFPFLRHRQAIGAISSPSNPPPVQQCRSAALASPVVANPLRMIEAGIWPLTGFPREQAAVGSFRYKSVPETCGERYVRSAQGELEMFRGGRWIIIYPATTGWSGLGEGRARVRTGGGHPDAPEGAPDFNNCVAGRFHKVRITIITSLTRPALGNVEGRRLWRYPVAVYGSCAKAKLSERRVHKLQEEEFGSSFAISLGTRPGALDQTTPLPPAPPALTPEERQECVNIAVNGILPSLTPAQKHPTMYRAGIRPNTPGLPRNDSEYVDGGYRFEPMPDGSEPGEPDCTGIHRLTKTVLQMEAKSTVGAFGGLRNQAPAPWSAAPIQK